MNRRQFSLGVFGAALIATQQSVLAEDEHGLPLGDNFGSIEFWDEHRVTLGDSREKFDAAFGDAFLKEDSLGARYRFLNQMSISVDICPDTDQADTIFITPYNFYAKKRRKSEEARFTSKQADAIIRLMTPTDHQNGRPLSDPMFGVGVVGTSKKLKESVKVQTYEWVDNTPRRGLYTVYRYWSFFGDGESNVNPGGREENIELIVLTLNVD